MCSTRNAWIGGSRRAAIIVPRAALRAYPPHHQGRSLSHHRRKAIAQTVGIGSSMERDHLKPSHRITPGVGIQLFEMSFGSLVVVVLFSSFFVYKRKRTLSGVLLVFPEFSTCRTRAFCVPPLVSFQPTKNIPSLSFLSFFSSLFPSAFLPACPISHSQLLRLYFCSLAADFSYRPLLVCGDPPNPCPVSSRPVHCLLI